ncbi:methylamine utilization protein [Pseudidiomarina woesei]|uniref:Plastocyanin n=1 Tax=Pseudidiomarina woesei TaxID=1381080 RepID=A0A0K6GXB2_9GAMM|nr:methylamine utilization protein [Pseudidiomarina woesei]CUA83376.1 Plastocyanin [Pseudidiomarina woesei]
MAKFQIVVAILLAVAAGSSSWNAQAQSSLTVTVTDKNGQPLPQAVVSAVSAEDREKVSSVAVMDQVNRLFDPFVLVIQRGDSVSFPNSDNIRHQVYSFSQTKPFELPLYSNIEAPEISFEQAGVVVLGCNIHDHMKAYIYVSPYAVSEITDAQGQVTVPAVTELSVWYPGLGDQPTDALAVRVKPGQTLLNVQLPVTQQGQNPPPPSALQQRFNRLKNNN